MAASFGALLEKHRKRRGLTLSAVAKAIGVSLVYYRDVELGKRRAFSTVSVNFDMRLSTTSEVIQVTGETPLIEKTESHVATIVTPEQVEDLPLNLRQFANLGVLAPATSLKVNNDPTRPSNLAISLVGGSGALLGTAVVARRQ